jgi:hypothetical protein
MPASLKSDKIHSSAKGYGVDVVPSIGGDEDAPIRLTDPKILRRATLKIDFYLIPIIGMFCELNLLSHHYLSLISPFARSIVFSSEYSYDPSPVSVQTVAQPRIDRTSPLFNFFFLILTKKKGISEMLELLG